MRLPPGRARRPGGAILPFFFNSYRVGQFTLVAAFAVAVLGLNLLVGYAGRSRSDTARSSRSAPT